MAKTRSTGVRSSRVQRDYRRMHEAAWSRSAASEILDSPSRRASQNPQRLWRRVGLKRGDIVVDVGAGTGFFTFPAAEAVGPDGQVFAVDISSELVDLVRERSAERSVANVHAILSTQTRIPIEDAVADVAILANVLHGISPSTVNEAVRLLRSGGRLVNVDWKKESTSEGPPLEHRLSPQEAADVLTSRGLVPRDSFELGPHHYVQVFERPRPSRHPARLVSAE